MIERQRRIVILKSGIAITLVAVLAVAFQNCSGGTVSGMQGGTGVNLALKAAPMPVEMNLNEIAYMSCPRSGEAVRPGDPLATPFFRLRFGAFDNRKANGFLDPLYAGTNMAGISLSTEAMNYLRKTNVNEAAIANFISTSPYSSGSIPVATILYQSRTTQSIASQPLSTTFLTPVTSPYLLTPLKQSVQILNGGTQKINYVPSISGYFSSVIGELNDRNPANAAANPNITAQEASFRAAMANQFLVLGFADALQTADATSTIMALRSPDNDITRRIFGRGYGISFNNTVMSVITEVDMNPTNGGLTPTDLTFAQNQIWDCSNQFTIVRDIDRVYYTTDNAITLNPATANTLAIPAGYPVLNSELNAVKLLTTVTPHYYGAAGLSNTDFAAGTVIASSAAIASVASGANWTDGAAPVLPIGCTSWDQPVSRSATVTMPLPSATSFTTTYSCTKANTCSNNGIALGLPCIEWYLSNSHNLIPIAGTMVDCPNEDPNVYTTAEKDQLRIVRRLLPADFWEINLRKKCAVPSAKAMASGHRCYSSGANDYDQTFRIQYVAGAACGVGMTECASKVSVCYRKD